MPRIDRAGQVFGKLKVLEDNPGSDQLLCQCVCGRESLYPRAISKPTYKGRLMCAWCAGSPCVICGTMIPAKPGRAAVTCSPDCAAEHVKRRGRDYYERVRDTEAWRKTRTEYLRRHSEQLEHNPEYAELLRKRHLAAVHRYAQRINADPITRSALLAKKREYAKSALDRLRRDGRYEAYLRKYRIWYASLTRDEYWRIYRSPALRREIRAKRHALSRKIAALTNRLNEHKFYTHEEELMIIERYADMGPQWLAEQLGRTYQSIIVKMIDLRCTNNGMIGARRGLKPDDSDI